MNEHLALRTIHQLCLDKIKNFPIASNIATNNMYLDNFLSSAPSTVLLKILIEHVRKIKLTWDVPRPTSIEEKWDKFDSQLSSFNSLLIFRFINLNIYLELNSFVILRLRRTWLPFTLNLLTILPSSK